MSADDNLSGQQFMTLYHGTRAENAEEIARTGLREAPAGLFFPAKWPTTTVNRQTADAYANRGGATVELHIPQDKVREHLWPAQDHMGGDAYAVKKHVPAEYVHAVHPVTEQVDYPR